MCIEKSIIKYGVRYLIRNAFDVDVVHNYKYITTKIGPYKRKLKLISMKKHYHYKKLVFNI